MNKLEVIKALLCDNEPSRVASPQNGDNLGWCIVILDRGHVLVGNVSISGDWITTTDASVIRVWGTTRGLGEIAAAGPTANTKLDPIGTVRSPLRALIGVVNCEAKKWNR